MAVLGIDFGKRRIGVAIAERDVAYPLTTITVESQKEALEKLINIISNHKAEKVVFGLPNPDRIGAMEFAKLLENLINIPIMFQDESLSSVKSLEKLRKKKKIVSKKDIDSMSAVLILQEAINHA